MDSAWDLHLAGIRDNDAGLVCDGGAVPWKRVARGPCGGRTETLSSAKGACPFDFTQLAPQLLDVLISALSGQLTRRQSILGEDGAKWSTGRARRGRMGLRDAVLGVGGWRTGTAPRCGKGSLEVAAQIVGEDVAKRPTGRALSFDRSILDYG